MMAMLSVFSTLAKENMIFSLRVRMVIFRIVNFDMVFGHFQRFGHYILEKLITLKMVIMLAAPL